MRGSWRLAGGGDRSGGNVRRRCESPISMSSNEWRFVAMWHDRDGSRLEFERHVEETRIRAIVRPCSHGRPVIAEIAFTPPTDHAFRQVARTELEQSVNEFV